MTVTRSYRASANEGLRLRCKNPECPWREASSGPDVDPLDKVDLAAAMLEELAEDSDAEGAGNGSEGISAPDLEPESEGSKCVLWPYGRTREYYGQVLERMGLLGQSSMAVIMSSSAHPGHWVSCLKSKVPAYVLTRRWSPHSIQHAKALGQKMLLEEVVQQSATADTRDHVCYLDLRVPDEGQVIEAYDVHQGQAWNDGVNLRVPEGVMQEKCQKLVAKELETFRLSLTGVSDTWLFSRHFFCCYFVHSIVNSPILEIGVFVIPFFYNIWVGADEPRLPKSVLSQPEVLAP